ncbi:MAG: PAS domain S-box protein [Fimbriimonadaceae bacterium]|nr:PAS domain S-box protein [Fimbriimonadaceae bacterium]
MDRRKTLSEREHQLLDLAASGHTDTRIAHLLGISEATVATYWGRIRIKLGPLNRSELVARFVREQSQELVDELKQRNQQLLTELREHSAQPPVENDSFYRDLIEHAPDAILIVNEQGVIETANRETCRLFGYELGQLEGQDLTVLIPDRYREVHKRHREDYTSGADRRRMGEHLSTVGRHRLGREFRIAATLAPAESAAGMRIMCIIRPAGEAP